MWLPAAQAVWRNIPNPSQQEVLTDQMGHPINKLDILKTENAKIIPGRDGVLGAVGRVAPFAAGEGVVTEVVVPHQRRHRVQVADPEGSTNAKAQSIKRNISHGNSRLQHSS